MNRIKYRMRVIKKPSKQGGVVLFVALIAMLILTLSGVAIMRSIDSSMTLAGNIAFRQATVAAADQGVNTAFSWLLTRRAAGSSNMWDSVFSAGYQSKIPTETDWTLASSWPAGRFVSINAGNGNTISYRIFRLCTVDGDGTGGTTNSNPGAVNAPGQACNTAYGTTGSSSSSLGNSQGANAPQYQGNLLVFYRIVVRVVGPRNATSYVQVMASLGA